MATGGKLYVPLYVKAGETGEGSPAYKTSNAHGIYRRKVSILCADVYERAGGGMGADFAEAYDVLLNNIYVGWPSSSWSGSYGVDASYAFGGSDNGSEGEGVNVYARVCALKYPASQSIGGSSFDYKGVKITKVYTNAYNYVSAGGGALKFGVQTSSSSSPGAGEYWHEATDSATVTGDGVVEIACDITLDDYLWLTVWAVDLEPPSSSGFNYVYAWDGVSGGSIDVWIGD